MIAKSGVNDVSYCMRAEESLVNTELMDRRAYVQGQEEFLARVDAIHGSRAAQETPPFMCEHHQPTYSNLYERGRRRKCCPHGALVYQVYPHTRLDGKHGRSESGRERVCK